MFQSKFIPIMTVILFATVTFTMASRFVDGNDEVDLSDLSKFSVKDLLNLMTEKRYPSRLADTMERRRYNSLKEYLSTETDSGEHRNHDSETESTEHRQHDSDTEEDTSTAATMERQHLNFRKEQKLKGPNTVEHQRSNFKNRGHLNAKQEALSTVSAY